LLDLTGGRYELRYQQHGANSSFAVLDRHAGGAPRNAATLSGGERFVAALAVALGLAAVAADRARLETLLIDEGFGALDDDRLDAVREALERLALDGGRLVGVVTHLPDLAEEVGTRIDVTALPPG
jgi:exonuclease SbcC